MLWRVRCRHNPPSRSQLIKILVKVFLIVQTHEIRTSQSRLSGPGHVDAPEELPVMLIKLELGASDSHASHRKARLWMQDNIGGGYLVEDGSAVKYYIM